MWLAQLPAHVEVAVGCSLKAHYLVGDLSVEHIYRHLVHAEFRVEVSVTLRAVGTHHRCHLLLVAVDDGINVMRAVVLWHIHKLGAQIAHVAALVGHVFHAHRRAHGDVVGCLNEVIVTIERSRHSRHIWYHRHDVLYLQLVEREREVLQGIGVAVVRIHLNVNAVVAPHSQLRRDALVVAQEDVVVLVDIEFLISYNRVVGEQPHPDAVVLHLGHRSETHAQHVFLVVVSQVERGSLLLQIAVEEGVEYVLRIFLVVAHLSVESQLRVVRIEREAHGVQLNAVGEQFMHHHIAVETVLWRRGEVHSGSIERVAIALQHTAHKVIAARIEFDACRGQQFAQPHLVYLARLDVVLRLRHQFVHLLQQHLVAAAGIHIDVEVAVACHEVGGVAARQQVDVDVVGEIALVALLHHEVAHGAHHTIILVAVGGNVEVGAERCRQRRV